MVVILEAVQVPVGLLMCLCRGDTRAVLSYLAVVRPRESVMLHM